MKNNTLTKAQVETLKFRGINHIHEFPNREQRRKLKYAKDHLPSNNRKATNERGVLSRLVVKQLVNKKVLFIERAT